MAARIDFERLAALALARAETLLEQWLPGGHVVAGEYRARNPLRVDHHEGSFSVSVVTGAWGDFASDDKGGDLVALYTYLFHGGSSPSARQRVTAARELADLLGAPELVPPPSRGAAPAAPLVPRVGVAPEDAAPKRRRTEWVPVLPVPASAPPPPAAHEFRGLPVRTWTYRDAAGAVLGYVCRFEASDGGKEIIPLTYCRHGRTGREAWRWNQWEEPRPLYGLDRLAARPGDFVLVVEGEKCADVGALALPDLVVVSWPGGGKALSKADWRPLAGRTVYTWPDCDAQREKLSVAQVAAGMDPAAQPLLPDEKQPGMRSMAQLHDILEPLGCTLWTVRIPAAGTVPGGWDIADAVEEGLAGPALEEWFWGRVHRVRPPDTLPEAPPQPDPPPAAPPPRLKVVPGPPPDDEPDYPEPPDDWAADLVRRKGDVAPCLANVALLLQHMPEWRGVIAYDQFAERVVYRSRMPSSPRGADHGDWEDHLSFTTAIWLQRKWGVEFSPAMVDQSVEVIARDNPYHPVREALLALPPWDGVRRNTEWLSDYLGVKRTEYTALVGQFFLRGMIKRVMEPGCKFDYCLVLEGEQGKGKSEVARILAWHWFCDTDLDLNNKDSLLALPGHWVYEIAEMGSLMKAEERKQKSFLSRQNDEYRPPYAKRTIKVPRQNVFVGTTNEEEYLKDATGGRRFWPVMCGGEEFDLAGLRINVERMFAEALADYRAGERCWPTPQEQQALFTPEQAKRGMPEPFEDILFEWVDRRVAPFSMAEAAVDGLGLTADKLTPAVVTRIGMALRKLGCARKEDRLAADPGRRRLYVPPRLAGTPFANAVAQPIRGRVDVARSDDDEGPDRAPF